MQKFNNCRHVTLVNDWFSICTYTGFQYQFVFVIMRECNVVCPCTQFVSALSLVGEQKNRLHRPVLSNPFWQLNHFDLNISRHLTKSDQTHLGQTFLNNDWVHSVLIRV